MLRIFQETINFATKQIFCASNLDSIPTSFFWFREFFLLFHFLSNPSKQITIICPNKDDLLHRSFSMSQKVGLLENSYRKHALEDWQMLSYQFFLFSGEIELYKKSPDGSQPSKIRRSHFRLLCLIPNALICS